MSTAWTIAKREIKSLFVSPVAYIVLGIFSFLSGIQFLLSLQQFDQALQQAKIQAQLAQNPEAFQGINVNGMLISSVIGFAFFLLLFTLPAVTMRSLSEEKNLGTYELLLTSPVRPFDIVFGKFLAGLFFFLAMIATHALFLVVMFVFGNPEPLPVVSGYLGLFLAGAAFVSIGVFASSLTRNQIVAFFIGLAVSLIFLMIGWASRSVSGNMSTFLEGASITSHFENFNKGLVTVSSIVYFLTVLGFFLAAAKISVQSASRTS